MILRFLTTTLFLVIATGLILHFQIEIRGISSWIGHLPGDLIVKKGDAVIYLPLTTSLLISIVLSIVTSALFKKKS